MWLITGPFDAPTVGDETSIKTKLLKPATTYDVGRHKENALFINSKKISRLNAEIAIEQHTEDDATDPAAIPTVSFRNTKTTALKVDRGTNAIAVNPGMTVDLESGDIIHFSGSITATLEWSPKICFHVEGLKPDLSLCASLGIKLVTKHVRDVNYHLTNDITAPLSQTVVLSLLNLAYFVTPAWLSALTGLPLTQTYTCPDTSEFLPAIDPKLNFPAKAWRPLKSRKKIFDGMRFILAVIGSGIGTETKLISDIVIRGGGDRQLINVEKEAENHLSTWLSVLRKRRTILKEGMKSGLVLVADSEAMLAPGVPSATRTAWQGMIESAKDAEMRIIPPSLVNEAILTADVSILDCVIEGKAKPLPPAVPSTFPEERSQLSAIGKDEGQPGGGGEKEVARPLRRLTRRATSQTPAPAPAPDVDVAPAPMEVDVSENVETTESQDVPRRKLLKRRAKTGGLVNTLLGLDATEESSVIVSSIAQIEEVPEEKLAPVPPTPGNRRSLLKRRAGTVEPQLVVEEKEDNGFGVHPLKKFKALFEESGQGRTSQMEVEEDEEQETPFSGVSGDQGTTAVEKTLPPVREEEEEEEEESQGTRLGVQKKKRKAADTMDTIDEEATGQANVAETARKKRRVVEEEANENIERGAEEAGQSQSQGKGPKPVVVASSSKTKTKGAAPGKPDVDPSFLRALASLKRGKRAEDTFDREFNQLRIAKPDIRNIDKDQQASSSKETHDYNWEGLDDFEKDVGVRGNFMQIVEIEVWKDKNDNGRGNRFVRQESVLGGRLDWDGRMNFKKFQKKGTTTRTRDREFVPLVLHNPGEYEPESLHADFNHGRIRKDARSFDDAADDDVDNDGGSFPTFTHARSKVKPRANKPSSRSQPIQEEEIEDGSEAEEEIRVAAEEQPRPSPRRGKGRPAPPPRAGRVPAARTAPKKFQPLFDPESEEEEDETRASAIAAATTLDDDTSTQAVDLTLRTSLPSQVTRRRETLKRKAVANDDDDDDDDGMTFGGFSKKPAAKRRR